MNPIAAYRKSVTAKPDVFESNLKLGLQLPRLIRPTPNSFFVRPTKLNQPAMLQRDRLARGFLIGHVLEKSKPEDGGCSLPSGHATLQPKVNRI